MSKARQELKDDLVMSGTDFSNIVTGITRLVMLVLVLETSIEKAQAHHGSHDTSVVKPGIQGLINRVH